MEEIGVDAIAYIQWWYNFFLVRHVIGGTAWTIP